MSRDKDIVELEMGEDGAYAPKGIKAKSKKKEKQAYGHNHPSDAKPKYFLDSSADEFLSGIDAGLDFIDKVVPRMERFLKLRG